MSKNGLFWGDDLTLITEENEVIVDGLLWKGQTVLLIAPEKAGKSVLALQLACCLTKAQPLFGKLAIPRPRTVLYMQFEGTRVGTQRRLISMGQAIPMEKNNFLHLFAAGIAMDTEEGYRKIITMLDEHSLSPDVFIIDPLYMCLSGGLCSEQSARSFIQTVRRLIDKYDATILIAHHTHRPKADEFGRPIDEGDNAIFGSFVWKAFADHTLLLTKDSK